MVTTRMKLAGPSNLISLSDLANRLGYVGPNPKAIGSRMLRICKRLQREYPEAKLLEAYGGQGKGKRYLVNLGELTRILPSLFNPHPNVQKQLTTLQDQCLALKRETIALRRALAEVSKRLAALDTPRVAESPKAPAYIYRTGP